MPRGTTPAPPTNFYPRPPRGGRHFQIEPEALVELFLSTPSARRATLFQRRSGAVEEISIHALREEGDPLILHNWVKCSNISIHALREEGDKTWENVTIKEIDFYPRPPRGGRRIARTQKLRLSEFLSTPSARRATRRGGTAGAAGEYFYPRPPRGGRLLEVSVDWLLGKISIHALREEGDRREL